MSPVNQTVLARFAAATSVFALLVAAFVAATSNGSGAGSGSVAAGPVAVTLNEFTISPGTISVPKGGSLAVTNSGQMVHNIVVEGTDLRSPDLAAGASGSLDLSSLEPGSYTVFCDIPGHRDSGMEAVLVVTAGDAGGADEVAAAADAEGTDHSAHGGVDLSSLEGSSDMAKRINKEFEDAMSAGVQEYLDIAERYGAGEIDKGNQKLEPEVLPDGTKKFTLTAAITDWQVEPGKIVKAWTYNGTAPGPWIRVEPGDSVQVDITNNLPVSTDIHWHGIDVPFDQDGLAPITQDYIRPFETYTYEFTVPDHPALGMYHAHMHGEEAVLNGMFAVFQVGDVELPRGRTIAGMEIPEDMEVTQEVPMVLNDAGVIGLSLNGKAFPETEPIHAKVGDWVLIHYYNEGLAGHPMHLHRQPHLVVSKDGFPLTEPYRVDTLWISPGERYSVLVQVEEPGIWAFHCHILNHAESADGLMGMVTTMIVE